MLTIRPIEEKERQESLCGLCGLAYKPDALAYSCYEREKLIGICQFHLSSGKVFIDDLANSVEVQDDGALFIMGRAALNFADLSGFSDAYLLGKVNDKIAKMIGFKKNDAGEWYMNLRGFFDSPCTSDGN